jgi:hypothetical protein
MERREVVYDRIRLDPIIDESINENLPKQSLEEIASRCLTIEVSLEEDGVMIIGYPALEWRNIEVPMLVKISDGISQGEFLFYLQEIEDEARNNWDYFLRMARLVSLEDELSEDLHGDEHEVTG